MAAVDHAGRSCGVAALAVMNDQHRQWLGFAIAQAFGSRPWAHVSNRAIEPGFAQGRRWQSQLGIASLVQSPNLRGRTCECNIGPVCRRHHKAKQAPRWHLEQPEPGVMTWRLPSGRVYKTTGDPYQHTRQLPPTNELHPHDPDRPSRVSACPAVAMPQTIA